MVERRVPVDRLELVVEATVVGDLCVCVFVLFVCLFVRLFVRSARPGDIYVSNIIKRRVTKLTSNSSSVYLIVRTTGRIHFGSVNMVRARSHWDLLAGKRIMV